MDPSLIAKWLHILSATVLFGTGLGTAFQMVWAMRTGRVETIRSVASGVVVADWLFTTPAGLIQPLTGIWLVHLAGYSFFEPWLVVTYALYVLAFLCWAPVVHLQIRIRDLAGVALSNGTALPEEARRAYRLWFALGWPAFAAMIAVYWLMVAKPVLW
ncbi:DUF2269 domain-containing protein [Roseovarius sp. CAU 1744]|uniref:DUF2269 family protein n=1 Tax=Roseovarius sp. CAU 1744 TaxID=3140368 RepID=UPI00325BEBFB